MRVLLALEDDCYYSRFCIEHRELGRYHSQDTRGGTVSAPSGASQTLVTVTRLNNDVLTPVRADQSAIHADLVVSLL